MSDRQKIKGIDRCGPTRKRRFPSAEAAHVRAAEILSRIEAGYTLVFRAYKCGYCGGWHLTSK